MSKVKDFKAFMKTKVNESEDLEGMEAGMNYGANPEDEEDTMDLEGMEEEEGEEEEDVTIEDLKAIVDDLEERISALEGGDEEEEEDEDAEGEEDESEENEGEEA
jgi:hypothetical protein